MAPLKLCQRTVKRWHPRVGVSIEGTHRRPVIQCITKREFALSAAESSPTVRSTRVCLPSTLSNLLKAAILNFE